MRIDSELIGESRDCVEDSLYVSNEKLEPFM